MIRQLQDSIDEPKYSGVKTTRQKLLEQSQPTLAKDEDEEGEQSEDEDEDFGGKDTDEEEVAEDGSHSEHDELPSSSTVERLPLAAAKTMTADEPQAHDLTVALRKSREEDLKKGKAVSKQLVRLVYTSLLD